MSGFEGSWTKRARARVGRVLKDKWKLERLIGVGGTAAVYQARHRNGQKVAVKMLHATLSEESELRARFVREGYIANKVEHPAALSVMDDDVDEDGSVFLVMELLDGETVEQRWRRHNRRLPADEILVIASQTLDVLEAAHDKKIVHRDIKPENLFLTREGQLKVLDFGIARLRESMSRVQVTQTGVAVGTPAYMAPEQARGRSELVDGQTDIWALGATMFTLLAGRLVHEAATGNEQLLAAMMRPAPAMASIVPQVPPAFAEVVDRALAYEKADRYASAAEMRAAVRAAYAQLKGNARPSSVRLSVPAFAEPADEPQSTAGWDPTDVEPALAPMPQRIAGALRARWRTALLVASALAAATIVLAGLHGRSEEPMQTATPTRHEQSAPLPPEPEATVAVPTLSATTPSPAPVLAVTQTAKRPRDAPKPRARPANADDDDPGPSRK